jgi:hypothetical protein
MVPDPLYSTPSRETLHGNPAVFISASTILSFFCLSEMSKIISFILEYLTVH